MAIENASNSCGHRCIRSNQQKNVFSCLAVTCAQPPSTLSRKLDGGKDQYYSIIFYYVSHETSHIHSILLFSFLADGEVLLDEVSFSRLD